jgi:hypothetical protein
MFIIIIIIIIKCIACLCLEEIFIMYQLCIKQFWFWTIVLHLHFISLNINN